LVNQGALEEQLALLVADCNLPFTIVEKESFKNYCTMLNPNFVMPSRGQLKDQIHHQSEKVKDKIKMQTEFKAEFPTFCADLWKSPAHDYYVGITAQFVDSQWVLHNLPVGFVQIIGPHTNQLVGKLIHETLQPFLGNHKPAAAVIDGGDIGAASVVGKLFGCEPGKFKDQTCVCHQLNNIIKKIFVLPRNPTKNNNKNKKQDGWERKRYEEDFDDDSEEEMEVESQNSNNPTENNARIIAIEP
jgi:hypothetical protein